MQILHISADFPDPLVPGKTRAVQNLLELAHEHDHRVWSLNRVAFRHGIAALDFGPGHRAVAYGAPPKGIALARRLAKVAEFVLEDAGRIGVAPDVVHAHKLSVEGLVGAAVARQLGCPLLVSAQGDSDLKIIGARADLRHQWRAIWRDATVALPFAPWTWQRLNQLLGERVGPTFLLPCAVSKSGRLSPRTAAAPVVRTVFHLASHRRKNAAALMRAVAALAPRHPALRLEIVGGGDAGAFAELAERAAALDPERIRLVGPRGHSEIAALLNAATCMALPSLRESFGMVFVEALFAGCPILGSAGWGIDGYLPEGPEGEVGLFVPPQDEAAIAEGLARLLTEEGAFKRRLASLQEDGWLDVFRRERIAATYAQALAAAATAGRAGAVSRTPLDRSGAN